MIEQETGRKYLQKVVSRESFIRLNELLERKKDLETLSDLREVLEPTRKKLIDAILPGGLGQRMARREIERCRAVVMEEMLNLKSCMKRYADPLDGYQQKEIMLRREAPRLIMDFFNAFVRGLDSIYEAKRQDLYRSVEQEICWATDFKDFGRIVGKRLLNTGAVVAEKASQFSGDGKAGGLFSSAGVKARKEQQQINDERILGQIWQRHMKDETQRINDLLTKLLKQHDEKWMELAFEAKEDDAEKTCLEGNWTSRSGLPRGAESPAIGVVQSGTFVTAAATVSLALGWHTFSYALINVFPPAALISLIAAATIGKLRETQYQEQVKDQCSRYLQLQRQEYVRLWVEGNDAEGNQQASLLKALSVDSDKRVEAALQIFRRQAFGESDPEIYRELLEASEQHLKALDETLLKLDEELLSLARQQPEYDRLRQNIIGRWPDMDVISIDFLATGEALQQRNEESCFPDCSSIALPYSKVLERELYRVFGSQYKRLCPSDKKKNVLLMGKLIGLMEEGKVVGTWSYDFVQRLNQANRVRRALAHRNPVSLDQARKLRELVVGEISLLEELMRMR